MKVYIVGDTGLLDGLALWGMADDGDVLLYTDRDILPVATSDELVRLMPDEIVIVGGTARVSTAVEALLGAYAPTSRVAGSSRFQTAVEISQEVRPVEPPVEPPVGTVLWRADHEGDDLREWHNSPSVSGDGDAELTASVVHSGNQGLMLTANGLAGIRMKVQTLGPDPKNLPDDAYYSAWYYVPFEGMRDNIFQYKYADADQWDNQGNPTHQTRRMLCKASLNWNGDAYDLSYNTRIRQATGEWASGETDVLATYEAGLPVNEWFHLEMRYVWGQDGTGRSTLWVNGDLAWDLQDISTEPNNCEPIQEPRQWAVNHYLSAYENDASRTTHIYIDEAKIADGRVGP
jgi:hypothetical protein